MVKTANETIFVPATADEVCCNGGDPVLGHPAVWYSFDSRKKVDCLYCDRQFVQAEPKND